jgi:hypothetical protein
MIENDANVLLWTILFANFPEESPLFHDIKRYHAVGKEEFIRLEVEVWISFSLVAFFFHSFSIYEFYLLPP